MLIQTYLSREILVEQGILEIMYKNPKELENLGNLTPENKIPTELSPPGINNTLGILYTYTYI